ncbi:SDR family oxidoreductase [Ktedonosporobacter rubrisoli]|uniref:SDR family oxidoreductase n=1 Tax=Ktedonosporobacter rubrisoli TaxID=2509675 RepID=A0A4P6JKR0_KTERU|nr:SDR family oxidoreductase [Ktedonosporobacter rubrisoli]QBD75754.1 SDR family oxidoreductase [Ktedonosporobacter rubrisoli]
MPQPQKIALITGANQGIGLEVARQLGKQNILVLIGSRNWTRGKEAAQQLVAERIEAQAIQLDVTDQQSIEEAARQINDSYGRLDILVNNAAIAPVQDSQPKERPLDKIRAIFETNVFGLFAVTQAMLPLLHRSSAGRIVNVSSGLASLGTLSNAPAAALRPFSWPYPSSKTAVNSITIFLAKQLEQSAIKVNAVDPGRTATAMNPQATRTPAQAAQTIVHYATLASDGPSGGFFGEAGSLPW